MYSVLLDVSSINTSTSEPFSGVIIISLSALYTYLYRLLSPYENNAFSFKNRIILY
jgi:hypothetical protein